MDTDLRFAPFRPIDDVISNANNYKIPDFSDLERVSNRITNNLLYYQTNYLLLVVIFCIIVGVINPLQFMVGLLTIVSLFFALFHFKNNNVQVQNLLQNKPYINLIVITIFSGLILNAIGSVLVFLFSICLPLTLVFIHAALRTRNLKNKIENKAESIGFKRTVMGFILEKLGAIHESTS